MEDKKQQGLCTVEVLELNFNLFKHEYTTKQIDVNRWKTNVFAGMSAHTSC